MSVGARVRLAEARDLCFVVGFFVGAKLASFIFFREKGEALKWLAARGQRVFPVRRPKRQVWRSDGARERMRVLAEGT